MRILIKLRAGKSFSYDLKYFSKVQGFIYGLLRNSAYKKLHDIKSYKYFCFSNIFPVKDFRKGDEAKLIVSSPDLGIIDIMRSMLEEIVEKNIAINIGEMQFHAEKIKLVKQSIDKSKRIRAATPIVIRIPEKNYERYSIPASMRKKRYIYWRPNISFNAFVKQLEENLIKKYKSFYKKEIKPERIFEIYRFIKAPIINHVIINGREQKFIGSLWEFEFTYLTEKQKKLLNFAIDCGFGERNSFGFGFVNVMKY